MIKVPSVSSLPKDSRLDVAMKHPARVPAVTAASLVVVFASAFVADAAKAFAQGYEQVDNSIHWDMK